MRGRVKEGNSEQAVQGGCGYFPGVGIGRCVRGAPLMIVRQGMSGFQRDVIVRRLVARGGLEA